MRAEACARCAATEGLFEVTITDESGGSFVQLCRRCRELIDTPRCSVCGHRKTGRHKADFLFFMDDWGTAFEICDECRSELIQAPRWVVVNG